MGILIKNNKPCHTSNYSSRNGTGIKYIVIHYTAGNGDTAAGNCNYFSNANRGASAHYFVGTDGIYQSVPDNMRAWHCGGTSVYKHPYCRNANSIGIEMCSRKDKSGVYYIEDNVIEQAIELTKYLMQKHNITIDNVIRHYDVWNKACPEPFVRKPELWNNFKRRLEEDAMTTEERKKFNALVNAVEDLTKQVDELKKPKMIYNYIDNNMPQWARPTIQSLVDKGYLQGDDEGKLNLDDDMLRTLVINARTGLYS